MSAPPRFDTVTRAAGCARAMTHSAHAITTQSQNPIPLVNVNRWRTGQMNLPGASPAELAALPKRTLLGKPAVFVDLRREYTAPIA